MRNPHQAEYLATNQDTNIYLENWTHRAVAPNSPGCLLVHGGPGLFGYMGDLAEEIGKTAQVWHYFQRGGQWSKSTGPMTVDAHIEDLRQVLRHIQRLTPTVTVIGHSWGGLLSMLTLAKYPDLASNVVLVGPMPFDLAGVKEFMAMIDSRLNDEERRIRGERMAAFATLTTRENRNKHFNELSDAIFKTYHFHPTFDRLSSKMDGTDADSFFASQGDLGRRMLESDLIQSLVGFSLPTTLIFGEYDPSPCARLAGQLAAVVPKFKSVGIKNCGHYPWWENRDVQKQFYALLANSLSSAN